MINNNIGDWGLGIGDWGLGPIPNPQSPIPKRIMIINKNVDVGNIKHIILKQFLYYKYIILELNL